MYAYLAGKLSLLGCWAALVAAYLWPPVVWFRSPALWLLGVCLMVTGLFVLGAGIANLGGSLRMGLPEEKTALKTSGIYRYTRNPIYVGGLLTCLAAVAWTANPWIAALCAVAAIVHHRVVLAEERYLASEFGSEWREYAARVRRYV